VIRAGEEGAEAFVVVEGEVSVSVGSKGQRLELARLGRGGVFGELALLTLRRRSADVVAVTDVDLMVLQREVFHKQLSSEPKVAIELLDMLGTRLAMLDQQLLRVTPRESGLAAVSGGVR
jgi:CRP-like cAMP-binding protein